MEFAAGQLHGAATLSFGQFRLQRGSVIARDPAAFGVTMKTAPRALGTDLPYEPIPSHAAVAEKQLAQRILEKAGGHSLPLGIDAHTLLYLHNSGVQAMAKSCYPARPELNPLQERKTKVRWKRKSSQSFRAFRDWQAGDSNHFVLYDYELDRAVEISRLAGWVLSELTEYTSTDNIVTRAAARAQLNTQEVEPVVTSAISALDRAGLLAAEALPQICKEDDPAGAGQSGH